MVLSELGVAAVACVLACVGPGEGGAHRGRGIVYSTDEALYNVGMQWMW